MGKYISAEGVQQRLGQKVRFTSDPTAEGEDNKMPMPLLHRLITEAEAQVEMDLSERYWGPFQTKADEDFTKLPQLTKFQITTLCYLQAVMRVLETDFGSGTVTDASKYMEKLEKRYTKMVETLLARRKFSGEETGRWKFPPLPGLKLNYHNEEADTGFAGTILTTGTTGDGGYPAIQMNDPSEDFVNGILDDLG